MQLLDIYRSHFGQAVRRQGNGWNGPCPLCGGEPGKSDRFIVWPERSDNLGDACAKNGIRGIWSCRQCGASGDTIAYLTKIDGMSFREALNELGITSEYSPRYSRRKPAEPARPATWQPLDHKQPLAIWQEHAIKFVEEAENAIWNFPQALAWLAGRGIGEAAIRQYRIGYLDEESAKWHGRFRPRKSYGLPPKTGQDGKVHDKLFIPRGILIPTFAPDGSLLNLRIRRHKNDLREGAPKYMELEGSYHGPLFLQSSKASQLAAIFVVEAELDAMLIHHASDGIVGALAVRTNRGKPDSRAHAALNQASRICIALDYDDAGAEGCDFWKEKYANSIRWPVPEGKDPGDAFAQGVDIREWIEASLPASVSLQDNESAVHRSSISQVNQKIQEVAENGQMDACSAGQNNWGEGASPKIQEKNGSILSDNRTRIDARALASDWQHEVSRWETTQPKPFPWATETDFSETELAAIKAALPESMELADIYLDVAVIWLLWRALPITYRKRRNSAGVMAGFSWDYSYAWKNRHEAQFDRFFRYVETSRALWEWLESLPYDEITAKNLFDMWGIWETAQ